MYKSSSDKKKEAHHIFSYLKKVMTGSEMLLLHLSIRLVVQQAFEKLVNPVDDVQTESFIFNSYKSKVFF